MYVVCMCQTYVYMLEDLYTERGKAQCLDILVPRLSEIKMLEFHVTVILVHINSYPHIEIECPVATFTSMTLAETYRWLL